MTTRKDEGAEFRAKQEKALEVIKEEEFATDAAATNERLASLDDLTAAAVKASLDANNPTGSHASYRDEKAEKKLADKRAKEA